MDDYKTLSRADITKIINDVAETPPKPKPAKKPGKSMAEQMAELEAAELKARIEYARSPEGQRDRLREFLRRF